MKMKDQMTDSQIRILDALMEMSDPERSEVLEHFCRSCQTPIEVSDWADRNYCYECSPDPME